MRPIDRSTHPDVEDHSRFAYSEILPDEQAATCSAFFARALECFAGHGITVERVMTDNHWSCTRSNSLAELLVIKGIAHTLIKPHRPRWALVALALSPVLFLLGWLVGVVLLWTSRIWTRRHKVIGTLATLPLALIVVLGGMVAVTTVRSTVTVSVTPATIIAVPTTIGSDLAAPTTTAPDPRTATGAPQVTRTSQTQQWTLWRVLTITGWALVLLIALTWGPPSEQISAPRSDSINDPRPSQLAILNRTLWADSRSVTPAAEA